jgi:hypothetical protein
MATVDQSLTHSPIVPSLQTPKHILNAATDIFRLLIESGESSVLSLHLIEFNAHLSLHLIEFNGCSFMSASHSMYGITLSESQYRGDSEYRECGECVSVWLDGHLGAAHKARCGEAIVSEETVCYSDSPRTL